MLHYGEVAGDGYVNNFNAALLSTESDNSQNERIRRRIQRDCKEDISWILRIYLLKGGDATN